MTTTTTADTPITVSDPADPLHHFTTWRAFTDRLSTDRINLLASREVALRTDGVPATQRRDILLGLARRWAAEGDPVVALRAAIAGVDPATLTNGDRRALVALVGASLEAAGIE